MGKMSLFQHGIFIFPVGEKKTLLGELPVALVNTERIFDVVLFNMISCDY